jgi:uncharacterized membrane protein YcaP (DUF421 family)
VDWLTVSASTALTTLASALAIVVVFVVLVRIVGLRTLSKLSSVDFAATVATGTIVASTALSSTVSVAQGAIAVAVLFVAQVGFSLGRRHRGLSRLLQNEALLLMAGPRILEDNLHHARMTEPELYEQLRQAGVTSRDEVLAVVLETTGDVSVLSGDGPLDDELLTSVRASDALR